MSNCATTQPGLRALHCNGSDINGVYAKVYAPDISATVFGQNIGCKAILASEGACNNGLLLGSLNNAPVYIGSNNENRILLAASGIACFACQVCVTNGLVIAAGSGLTINGSGARNITSRKLMFSNWNVGDTKAIKLLNISLNTNTRIIGDLTIYKGARTSNHGFVGKAFIWASSAGSYSASAVCLFNPTATFNSGDSYLGNIWWCTQSADLYYCIVTEANYEFLGFEINIVGGS